MYSATDRTVFGTTAAFIGGAAALSTLGVFGLSSPKVEPHVADALGALHAWIAGVGLFALVSWLVMRWRDVDYMPKDDEIGYSFEALVPLRYALRGPASADRRDRVVGWVVVAAAGLFVLLAPVEWWPNAFGAHREVVQATALQVLATAGFCVLLMQVCEGLPMPFGLFFAWPGVLAYWLRDALLLLAGIVAIGFAGAAGVSLAQTLIG